ncbi:MAG: hypothetical protein RR672_07470 [Raoultibacter sp.]
MDNSETIKTAVSELTKNAMACPLCGGEVWASVDSRAIAVHCKTCGITFDGFTSFDDFKKLWNGRRAILGSCEYESVIANGKVPRWRCGCGHVHIGVGTPRFCPACGARVVERVTPAAS